MNQKTKPFTPTLSPLAEVSFVSALRRFLPELGGVPVTELKTALKNAMSEAVAEHGASQLCIVKTEESLSERYVHVSEILHPVMGGPSRMSVTTLEVDVRFQVSTAICNCTVVESGIRLDLSTMQPTVSCPLFELKTCLEYAKSAVEQKSGLASCEIHALLRVVDGLAELQRDAALSGMSNFEGLDAYSGPEIGNFFRSELTQAETVVYLRQIGQAIESSAQEAKADNSEVAYAVAVYQLARVLELYPDYLQDCYELLMADA